MRVTSVIGDTAAAMALELRDELELTYEPEA
jgi:hypothetical protein